MPRADQRTTTRLPKIKALVPWYGSNRILAKNVGDLLGRRSWVGVPFAGGMCEITYINARTVVVNDLHGHVMNLAVCVADPVIGPKMWRMLRRLPFHPTTLVESQSWCRNNRPDCPDVVSAMKYFTSAWMSRNGKAGTKDEFDAGLSVRWEAGGGDSAVRFHNAVMSLREWRRILSRCTFVCLDAFEFLSRCQDKKEHGIYCDPPWPGDGDSYLHTLSFTDHERLARCLSEFEHAQIVVRLGDCELARSLYRHGWNWHKQTSRTAANKDKHEALITRN